MAERKDSDSIGDHFRLRRCILLTLYEHFKSFPYATMEPGAIEDACGTDPQTLNWNLVYLEKNGWVELGKSIDAPPYIACSISISASGIDMVEDEAFFDAKFTPSPTPD